VGIDKNLAQAAFKLERVGSMPDDVIETPQGYHVIMLIGKRAAVNRPLMTMEKQLKQQIRRETVNTARRDYIRGLKEEIEIRIETHILSGMVEELRKPPATKKNKAQGLQPTSRRKQMPTPPPMKELKN
jgi:hypothetical protein